jgi:hypothetical protein
MHRVVSLLIISLSITPDGSNNLTQHVYKLLEHLQTRLQQYMCYLTLLSRYCEY